MAGSGTERAATPQGVEGAGGGAPRHIPVLLSEVLASLAPRDGEHYIDATFGAGGYTAAILGAADCHVLAIDQDPQALAAGEELVRGFAPRLAVREGNFADLAEIAGRDRGVGFDGIVLDIGVSSMQLDDAARGFSFRSDGPLDMRMSRSGPTAADVVNTAAEAEIADILYAYGEERRSRAIAKAIVTRRREQPLLRTTDLAELVERVLGRRPGDDKHPATRTFQALRNYVNDELAALAKALCGAERILAPGGRLVVVTFHSLEDRIVKRFLRLRSGRMPAVSRHQPQQTGQTGTPSFQILNPRPLEPGNEEVRANPRARSARLRAARRTEAAAHAVDLAALGLPRLANATSR